MRHYLNVVLFDPFPSCDPGSIRKHFIHVSAPRYRRDTLLHCQNRLALVGSDYIVGVDADQQVVSEVASLPEKLDMSVMKVIRPHVDVNSYQGTICPFLMIENLDVQHPSLPRSYAQSLLR